MAWLLGFSFRFNFWVLAFYLSAWFLGFVTATRVLLTFYEIFCSYFVVFL
ncbi:MAG: hypothetical protein SOW03_05380 [Campylobacter sp.]|nr:hypothetical protein [Campylobacteraceae bacterium]MDY2635751.1 hypothetical protein [Campylobacter sp.]